MTLIQTTELEASFLRRCLHAPVPEHRVLCILRFFERLHASISVSQHTTLVEGYLREFIPALADAARQADPFDLLPQERMQLRRLLELSGQNAGAVVSHEDFQKLADFRDRGMARDPQLPAAGSKAETNLAALFVEDVPELALGPRGRLLWLSVRASACDRDEQRDIIHIFNPHIYAEGPLVRQAEFAVGAARSYLRQHCGLSIGRRYRLDIRVLPVTSRLTGNSLGIALAVGAVIAIAKREELREAFAAQPLVAFTGAVGADGTIEPIDGEGLRSKLERAHNNRLNYVAIPRAHVSEAYETVRELEQQSPGHTLNIVGADTIDAILNDRNLIDRQHRPIVAYTAARVRKGMNNPKVGLPVLLSLLAILAILIIPWITSRLDTNPATVEIKGKGILVKNQHGRTLWGKEYQCDSLDVFQQAWRIFDLDADHLNEVLVIPPTDDASPDNARLFVYAPDGTLRFARNCSIWDQYPGDNVPGMRYQADAVHVFPDGGGPIIVTLVSANNPSRAHIRTWTTNGDSTGWYINAGTTHFELANDLDGDGGKELFFTGFNVRMSASALFVLRSRASHGAAPPYSDPQYDLKNVLPGNALHYMIFPKTDLAEADTLPYNGPRNLRRESADVFRLDVLEGRHPASPPLAIYYLNGDLQVDHAEVCDRFKARRQRAGEDGRLPPVNWSQYLAHLRDTVTYWQAGAWVTDLELRPRW
ncbi:MAG: hypothetical protein HZB43_04305 [candidate division Zixibacteria bacterium]|nr:hypothetical protein [candidate division Zixibacteria bacterium]